MSRMKIFQATQLGFLIVCIALFLLLRRRGLEVGAGISDDDMRRARARIQELLRQGAVEGDKPHPRGPGAAAPVMVTSALLSWSRHTPPYQILGVPKDAKPELVEGAYKALFRKYHPDRFASWGDEYQSRAHEIITLLQAARDKMKP